MIDYIKWDMNRNINKSEMGTYLETKVQSHAYILGLYEVRFLYLAEKYENILFILPGVVVAATTLV